MSKHIYIAQFLYGSAGLVKAEVKKETAKTYVLTGRDEHLIGEVYYGIHRLLKSDRRLRSFENETDAIAYLLKRAEQHVERCKDALSGAVNQVDYLAAELQERSSK